MYRYGIDLGGSKIEIIALDDNGNVRLRRRVPTPRNDYAAIVECIVTLVRDAERETGERGSVGMGAPGAVSHANGRLKNSNTQCLNGQPLREDIEARLERSIRIANDANCFALSEAVDGAAAGAPAVFGVILGTGVGGGIIVNGAILEGVNAIAGEWGHNPLPLMSGGDTPVRRCYCGREGCVETWLSGPGFAADHAARVEAASGQVPSPMGAEHIVRQAQAGDPWAKESLKRYAERLARSLAQVINILDPHVIVLGGGMSNIDYLYEALPELLAPHVFSDRIDTRVLKHRHGDSSGVRGAAWLWNPPGR